MCLTVGPGNIDPDFYLCYRVDSLFCKSHIMSLKIYIIAGEPSGDLHGAHLVRAILEQDPSVRFRGFGGSKMEAEGVILDQDIDQLSFMGFVEVVRHSPQILANFSLAKKSIRSCQPDAILYLGFPRRRVHMPKWPRSC